MRLRADPEPQPVDTHPTRSSVRAYGYTRTPIPVQSTRYARPQPITEHVVFGIESDKATPADWRVYLLPRMICLA
jgi:hypothetical protein